MLAVHFGGGNIGRGFIGKLLSDAGYEVVFVDVNDEIVDLLNEKREYKVVLAADQSEETIVKNVRAINSKTNSDEVISAIAKADLVTTAVGPTVLGIIANLIRDGLKMRAEAGSNPLNIIACENMIGGSSFLKEKVYESLNTDQAEKFDQLFAFPNAAVDRIVPIQTNEDKLMVLVEPFYEWAVDQSMMIGEVPAIEGVTFVDDLSPYIERKLFTVNTGHAAAAYLGYEAGLKTIKDAMEDDHVLEAVRNTLQETGAVLVEKYGFNSEEHQQYINKIVGRFKNPHINDDITRVARGPLRKLGRNDRLVSPAVQYIQYLEKNPENLAKVIAAALKYDVQEDPEAVELQEKIKANGYEETMVQVCGLSKDHPLVELVLKNLK
ncbi:mannitol-1-phosphate 5-dehydrogenase [Cytobacillus gottheilii]|uniref:Mannitol-1-phosphate 5-dehydrogenase n=1 Tax=Cytobacillus gottheilii TaxID=859144 RepID=A0ABX8FBK0_9BACI|nr:mannitol-1-phosphate 5-dehydrogenase [Cytobacillus gottheilii]QVY60836.1 mannitol-1-phosphate 5-dehydrogenase [Cytobacillus gottheilii]